jgi:hypothetical protein
VYTTEGMVCCSRKAQLIATGVGALVFLTLGAVFQPMIDAIVRDVVDSQVSLLSHVCASMLSFSDDHGGVIYFSYRAIIYSSIYRTWTAIRCRF